MWKPGNLVTIKGIVYRVKRARCGHSVCSECDLNDGYCGWPNRGGYPLPSDCYLKRVSP